MWHSVSGKAIILILTAIIGIFILRIMAKRSFKIIQPTWLDMQKQTATQPSQPILPTTQNFMDTFRKDITSW